jgi:hypothetical protein
MYIPSFPINEGELSLLIHFPMPRHWVEFMQPALELKEHDKSGGSRQYPRTFVFTL